MSMWVLEFKHNLATHILMIKLDVLKMFTVVKPCLASEPSFAHVIFAEYDMCSLLLFSPTPQSLVKGAQENGEDT
jgi:hypothetical protein